MSSRLRNTLPIRNKEAKNPVSDAQGDDKIEQSLSFCEIQGEYIPSSQSNRPPSNKKTFPSVVKADLTLEDDNAQSLSFHGIQGREDSTPVCSHQSLSFCGTQEEAGDPLHGPLVQSLSLRGTQQLQSSLFPKGRARRSPSETLLAGRTNQQATQDGLTNSPELRMVTEQPRASPTSAPSQSLPPTS